MSAPQGSKQLLLHQELYQSLKPNQTRVLRIHPSTDAESQIECDLVIVTLAQKMGATSADGTTIIPYETLSYTWGGPGAPKSITLNSISYPVSKNLHDALRHIRLPNKERYLWADACCINQEDIEEKEIQVAMMFNIYLKASQTVIWFGLPTPEDTKVFKLIGSINSMSAYERSEACRDPETRAAARNFIETKPWFQRTWVRQEAHASRKIVPMCGPHSCSYKAFERTMDELMPDMADPLNSFDPHRDPSEPVHKAKMIYALFKRDCDTYHFPEKQMEDMWFHLIMRSTLYDSTLPHDKVYAVLGIVAKMTKRGGQRWHVDVLDSTETFPGIDYSKSVSIVFQDFTKHAINTSGHLGCLSIFQDREKVMGGDDNLPSWAIDLRRNAPRFKVPLEMYSLSRSLKTSLIDQNYDDHGRLRLWGRRMGTVSSVDSPWKDGLQREVSWRSRSGGLESCFSTNDRWFPKEGNKGMEETFKILEKLCSYVWVEVAPTPRRLYAELSRDGFEEFSEERHRCFAFASHQVWEGDLIVHLFGADVPFLLRYVQDNEYIFLGPVVLVLGRIKKLKDRDMFRYSMADHDPRGSSEFYVLV